MGEVAQGDSLHRKKSLAREVFGSNLFLDNKKARGCSIKPWSFLAENPSYLKLECLYELVRTAFKDNPAL